MTSPPIDHIIKYGLLDLYNRNESKIKLAIQKTIQTSPSATDGCGFVYGYNNPGKEHPSETTNFHIKLGRTERDNPADRVVREWHGKLQLCFATRIKN